MKQIDKAKNYYINRKGEVFNKSMRKLTLRCNRDGYVYGEFYENNKCTAYTIHRIVATAFIPNPENKPCVNHIDGNKSNNNVSNLEWVTYSENTIHSFKLGLSKPLKGEDNPMAILTTEQVHEVCMLMQDGYRNKELVEKLGISSHIIKNIRRGKSWVDISSLYSIPEKSKAVSEATARWICRMILDGKRNCEIVELSTNPRVKKHIVSQIKNGKMYPELSKEYNLI